MTRCKDCGAVIALNEFHYCRGAAMTDTELQAIAQRAEKATEGPWENCRGFVRSPVHGSEMTAPGFTVTTSCLWVAECRDGEAFYNADANADFIAHARTDIPALLAEITRLRAQVEARDKALKKCAGLMMEAAICIEASKEPAVSLCADLRRAASQVNGSEG